MTTLPMTNQAVARAADRLTLKEIHAMFVVGSVWDAVNTRIPKASGTRTLIEKLTTQLVWRTPHAARGWMTLPKAREVIEARPGYLKYMLDEQGNTVSLTELQS